MDLKKCEKCGTSVPEAKAFCPECGASLVDEATRETTSEHNAYAETAMLSKSSYNLMLADMDLNISESPNLTAERLNISKDFIDSLSLDPPKEDKPAGTDKKWIIVAAACAVFLFLLLVAIILVVFVLRTFSV
jgi:hypothetical protein